MFMKEPITQKILSFLHTIGIETIEKESVCGYYDTDNIEDTGMYIKNDFGSYDLIEDDSDEDYEESEDDSESEDESLIDSDEDVEENDIEC